MPYVLTLLPVMIHHYYSLRVLPNRAKENNLRIKHKMNRGKRNLFLKESTRRETRSFDFFIEYTKFDIIAVVKSKLLMSFFYCS